MNKALRDSAIVTSLAAIGAFLSRWHGGGFISGSPKVLKAFLWSLPFAAVTGYAWWNSDIAINLAWRLDDLWHTKQDIIVNIGIVSGVVALVALLLCMVFKNTGHGGGMDLAHNPKEPGGTPARDPEKLEHLILFLHGKIPGYWYDALLLAVIGFFSTLAPAVALAFVNPLAGIVVSLGGIAKAPAYMIGWAVIPDYKRGDGSGDLDEATEIGEALTGLFAYTTLAIALILVLP